MFKIKLVNFRKWDNHTFDLGSGITRIIGESGMGKSTIFEAIYWCLYGRIRSVSPKQNTSGVVSKPGKTEVIVEVAAMQIHRTGQKSISVICGDEMYSGEIAQSKIDAYFGTHEMFLMASYLRAEASHPLISATPSEKRELTSLVFPGASKYDIYRSRLSDIRRNDELLLVNARNKYLSSESSVTALEESQHWLLSSPLLDKISPMEERTLTKEIARLKTEKDTVSKIVSRYDSLKQQLASLPELQDVSPLEEEMNSLQSQLIQCTVSSMNKESKIKYLQDRLDSLSFSDVPEDKCKELLVAIKELLSIGTSQSSLESELKSVTDEYHTKSSLLCSYEKSLVDMEYNAKIQNVLECPSCHTKLQYTDKLIQCNDDIHPRTIEHRISSKDVRSLRLTLDKLESRRMNLYTSYNRYQEILNQHTELVHSDLVSLQQSLNNHCQALKESEKIKSEIAQIQSDTRNYITTSDMKEMQSRIKILAQQISEYRSIEHTRRSLLTQVECTERDHPWISTHEEHILHLETRLAKCQDDLLVHRQSKERVHTQQLYLSHKNIIAEQSLEIKKREGRISSARQLEDILSQAYHEYVNEKLKEIEYDVCVLGKYFFDDTMNITLTGGVKPSFDIHIEYGDTVYDDIRSMSTGERKRLSIILMMVLTKYTDGKVMILDEAFTSIGLETRGIIMGEIQKLGIPIYITSHDELPGNTAEINLNSIQ